MQKFIQETPNGHISYHYKTSQPSTETNNSNNSKNSINKDNSSSNPNVFQFTTNCFPRNLRQYEKSKIPFGVFIQPFTQVLHVKTKKMTF